MFPLKPGAELPIEWRALCGNSRITGLAEARLFFFEVFALPELGHDVRTCLQAGSDIALWFGHAGGSWANPSVNGAERGG